jgi:hypothetical protein
MDFLSEEDRQNLLIEYKHMHDENWQRGHGIWLVNSIFITGSLLVAFQATGRQSLAYFISSVLVIATTIIQITAGKVTSVTYRKMKEIRARLGMTETTRLYESEIRGKWWYIIRTNTAYVLFVFLMSTYLFLWINRLFLSLGVFSAGIIILIVKEIVSFVRREAEKRN